MKLLYRIGLFFYRLGIYLASLRSPKAAAWIQGRKRQSLPPAKTGVRYWFHCASLGEFEQARPLMEHFNRQGVEICLTFFSPSGFEQRKNWETASWVGYLPLDSPGKARSFVAGMQADKVFFVKYEFWYFFLKAVHQSGVPFYLISARFRKEQAFFRWYGSLHREMLECYTHVFTQDAESVSLLRTISFERVTHAGDTRFDRVLQLKENRKELPLIAGFCAGHYTVVAGSSWPAEEKLLQTAFSYFPHFRWVIVPHDISGTHLKGIEERFSQQLIRYSALERGEPAGEKRVLLVDRIGLLGNTYPYGKVALVGGGFSNALHNILEAAVWGMPVMYGSHCGKYPEGKSLAAAGGGFLLDGEKEWIENLRHCEEESIANSKGALAAKWVVDNAGASERILAFIGK